MSLSNGRWAFSDSLNGICLFITETEDLSNFLIRWTKKMIAFTLSLFYVINDVGVRAVRSPNARIFMPDAFQLDYLSGFFAPSLSAHWGHRKNKVMKKEGKNGCKNHHQKEGAEREGI
jgi:hypothetical protein